MKTLMYIDFNDTIDDIVIKKRGYKFFSAITRLANLNENDLDIYLITKADTFIEDDITVLFYLTPNNIRKLYKGIIENGGETLVKIDYNNGYLSCGERTYLGGKSKLDGVELSRKIVDPKSEAEFFLFVGNDEKDDLPMINAQVKAKKRLILANNRKFIPQIENVIKTSKHSYGVASAIERLCDELQEKQKVQEVTEMQGKQKEQEIEEQENT